MAGVIRKRKKIIEKQCYIRKQKYIDKKIITKKAIRQKSLKHGNKKEKKKKINFDNIKNIMY